MSIEFSTEKAKKIIDCHDVISFDIFDTLLLRPYVKPTDLFFHLEKLEDIKGFAKERIAAEARARKKYTDTEEITYDEIYYEIDEKYKNLKEKELELERLTLSQNPEVFELYEYAKGKNKKIIITSDMYLSKDFVKIVLEKNGYDDYYALFLSSEEKCTKWSCNLYKHILKDLNIPAKKILHIGDNKESDCKKATEVGISNLHYPQVAPRFFIKNPRAKLLYEENDYSSSIFIGVLAINFIRESLSIKKSSFWEHIGYEYGGVVCYGYMKWLEEQVKDDKKDYIMFVARDGYSLKKVFDSFGNKDIKTHYIYAPRFINLICTLEHNQDRNKIQIIVDYYLTKSEELKKLYSENNEKIQIFFNKNLSLIKELSKKEEEGYKNYLETLEIKDYEKSCIVDTFSLRGSSQKLIRNILQRDIQGYYWQMINTSTLKYRAFFKGDSRTEFYFKDWNFMEWLMTAPEYPVENISEGKPIYKIDVSKCEKIRYELYPDVSSGIEKFALDINRIFRNKAVFITSKLIQTWINLLAELPTEQEENRFEEVKHAIDSDHNNYIHLFPWWYEKRCKIVSSYLFGFIPFIKIKEWRNNIKYYILNIPIFKIFKKRDKEKFYLFGFIYIFEK